MHFCFRSVKKTNCTTRRFEQSSTKRTYIILFVISNNIFKPACENQKEKEAREASKGISMIPINTIFVTRFFLGVFLP